MDSNYSDHHFELNDLLAILLEAQSYKFEVRQLRKENAELRQKCDDLLNSSVKQANESIGLALRAAMARALAGTPKPDPVMCTRGKGHAGPCNGSPTDLCPGGAFRSER